MWKTLGNFYLVVSFKYLYLHHVSNEAKHKNPSFARGQRAKRKDENFTKLLLLHMERQKTTNHNSRKGSKKLYF